METIIVRSHERITYKRCQVQWYWAWRRGLVPKQQAFKALTFGSWMHEAQKRWYAPGGTTRDGNLAEHIRHIIDCDFMACASDLTDTQVDQLAKSKTLAIALARAYQAHYSDDGMDIIAVEIPLEFIIRNTPEPRIVHRLKPDAVFRTGPDTVMLLETKTAASVKTDHLVIDDQARPYGVLAERALKNARVIRETDKLVGIRYNYIRKGMPDSRATNAKGESLNKDGSVSVRQPIPLFRRYDVTLTAAGKLRTLYRIERECVKLANTTIAIRAGWKTLHTLHKTPHWSCPRVCQYFEMCAAHENGADIREMERSVYRVQNPYEYAEDTTDVPRSFEMG